MKDYRGFDTLATLGAIKPAYKEPARTFHLAERTHWSLGSLHEDHILAQLAYETLTD